MEKDDLILGHFTIFDSGRIGARWYRVLIRLLNISKEERLEFVEFLKNHQNTVWLGEVGGRWDVAANFAFFSPEDFNVFYESLSERFGSFVKEVQIFVYVDVFDYSRSYLGTEESGRKTFYHHMNFSAELKLDELDKKIIRELSHNARISFNELGEKLQVSRLTVAARVKKMIDEKLILGFRTFSKLNKIGYFSHMVFLQINKMNKERETELYLYLKMIKKVTFVVKHLESWRVGLEIETKNDHEFQAILLDIRSHFSDLISDYDSFPLLQDHIINYFPEGVLK
jgi:DNA-binding Lrp family transcriptional regulator